MDNHDASILHDTAVYRAELVRLLTQRFDAPGTYETAIAPLHVIRLDGPSELIHVVHRPALCLIVQGRKEVGLGDERFLYDPLNYLVVSVTLPVSGRVIEASPEAPYFCVRLDFDPAQLTQLITESPLTGMPQDAGRGMFLDKIDVTLLDTMLRWCACWITRATSACSHRWCCVSCITACCAASTGICCMKSPSAIRRPIGSRGPSTG